MSRDNAMLIVVTAPSEAQGATRWRLEPRPMVVGRHPSCDICLPDRQISREHARITHARDGYFVEDLGSKNGTFINGQPVAGPTPLKDGDLLQIGLAYRLSFVGAEATVPMQRPLERDLILRLDPERKAVWVHGQELLPALSPAQFDLLHLLMEAQGAIVERDDIAQVVWGSTEGVSEQAIDALVRRLRRRIAELAPERELVATVRGYGFRLEI